MNYILLLLILYCCCNKSGKCTNEIHCRCEETSCDDCYSYNECNNNECDDNGCDECIDCHCNDRQYDDECNDWCQERCDQECHDICEEPCECHQSPCDPEPVCQDYSYRRTYPQYMDSRNFNRN